MRGMKFTQLLAFYRDRAGYTKTELAAKVGVSPSYIMNLESDLSKPPTMERCRAIARALSLSPNDEKMLLATAASERVDKEDLEAIIQRKSELEKTTAWSSIRGSAECPHCKKEIDVEVNRSGDVLIYARVVGKIKKY